MFYTDSFRFEGFLFPAIAHAPLSHGAPSSAEGQETDTDPPEKEQPAPIIVPQTDE